MARLHQADIQVADRIQRLRRDKGMTLRELAQATNLSDAYLSRVENHKAAIPIANLSRVAEALQVPLRTFFDAVEATHPIDICRSGDGKRARMRSPKGFLFELLAADKTGKLMEPILVDVASAKRITPLNSHAGDEFNYIIEGECLFLYGKEEIRLHKGDSVYFDATVPHATRQIPGKLCRLIAVVASRDYLFHGDISRLLNEGGRR